MVLQWLSLVGAIWLQSINGTNFNFPAYSSQLKELLSLTQLQLNNLAFASDAGKLLGFLSGITAIYLPLWLVLLVGSTLGFIGYGVQYLFLINQISSLPYALIFLLTVMAGNSICWINTVCYIIALQNFPLDHQVAVGLSTSYQGLSAKIYADIVDTFMISSTTSQVDKAKAYLLLNSILPLIVCCVSAPLVREGSMGRSRKLSEGFIAIFMITLFTGAYAIITSLLKSTITRLFSPSIILICMGGFLMAPLVVPFVEKIRESMEHKCLIRREKRVYNVGDQEGGVARVENGVELEGGKSTVKEALELDVVEEIGATEMVRRVDFWLYFFVYFFGATLGLVYLNNLGQIAESRGSSRTSSLVSLASSCGYFGRLIPSLINYYTSRSKHKVSRPATIAVMMAPMTSAFFILLNSSNLSLHISTAIIGVCTGAITSITVSTTSELFGPNNFGVNHNILVTNIPIGSFLFGDLAALFYRKQAQFINGGEGGASSSDGKCMGMECYQKSFIIWGSLCCFGTLLALLLHHRTKKLYSQLL